MCTSPTAPAPLTQPATRRMPLRINPNFNPSPEQLDAESRRLTGSPVPLPRPVIVLAGYRSPKFTAEGVARRLCALTSGTPSDFHPISYANLGAIPPVVEHVLRTIQSELGATANDPIPEIDIVATSMGGLVARAAAASDPFNVRRSRLRVRRLFTLATPHRGANLARTIAVDRAAHDMLPGSQFLADLDRALPAAEFELVCYAQLRDWWVGATNAAPPDREPIWLDTRTPFEWACSHFAINFNRAILIDIARRLRGESPLAGPGSRPPSN